MATGKKAKDIFEMTGIAKVGLEAPKRHQGKKPMAEPYQKVTVCLFDRHVLYLDKVILANQELTGKHVKRAEVIRALLNQAEGWLQPGQPSFAKAIRSLKLE